MTNNKLRARVQVLEEQIAQLLGQRQMSTEELVKVLEELDGMSDEELDRTAGSDELFARLAKSALSN